MPSSSELKALSARGLDHRQVLLANFTTPTQSFCCPPLFNNTTKPASWPLPTYLTNLNSRVTQKLPTHHTHVYTHERSLSLRERTTQKTERYPPNQPEYSQIANPSLFESEDLVYKSIDFNDEDFEGLPAHLDTLTYGQAEVASLPSVKRPSISTKLATKEEATLGSYTYLAFLYIKHTQEKTIKETITTITKNTKALRGTMDIIYLDNTVVVPLITNSIEEDTTLYALQAPQYSLAWVTPPLTIHSSKIPDVHNTIEDADIRSAFLQGTWGADSPLSYKLVQYNNRYTIYMQSATPRLWSLASEQLFINIKGRDYSPIPDHGVPPQEPHIYINIASKADFTRSEWMTFINKNIVPTTDYIADQNITFVPSFKTGRFRAAVVLLSEEKHATLLSSKGLPENAKIGTSTLFPSLTTKDMEEPLLFSYSPPNTWTTTRALRPSPKRPNKQSSSNFSTKSKTLAEPWPTPVHNASNIISSSWATMSPTPSTLSTKPAKPSVHLLTKWMISRKSSTLSRADLKPSNPKPKVHNHPTWWMWKTPIKTSMIKLNKADPHQISTLSPHTTKSTHHPVLFFFAPSPVLHCLLGNEAPKRKVKFLMHPVDALAHILTRQDQPTQTKSCPPRKTGYFYTSVQVHLASKCKSLITWSLLSINFACKNLYYVIPTIYCAKLSQLYRWIEKFDTSTYYIKNNTCILIKSFNFWTHTSSLAIYQHISYIKNIKITNINLNNKTITIHTTLKGGGRSNKKVQNTKSSIHKFTQTNLNPFNLQQNTPINPNSIKNYTTNTPLTYDNHFTITCIDSLGNQNWQILQNIKSWIKNSHPNSSITIAHSTKEQQTNGHDCGPWTIMNAHMSISAFHNNQNPVNYICDQSPPISITSLRKQIYELAFLQWSNKTDTDCHNEIGHTPITKKDLENCAPKKWYTDNIINFAFAHWLNNHTLSKISTKNCAFYSTIILKNRIHSINNAHTLLPININNNHWILAIITKHEPATPPSPPVNHTTNTHTTPKTSAKTDLPQKAHICRTLSHDVSPTSTLMGKPYPACPIKTNNKKPHTTNNENFHIIFHNINGKYVKATHNLIDSLKAKKQFPDCICWQETHATEEKMKETSPELLQHYEVIYYVLTPEMQKRKASKNGSTSPKPSEGMAIFLLKKWLPITSVSVRNRNNIILNINVSKSKSIIVANIYAPCDPSKNGKFFTKCTNNIIHAKKLSKGKTDIIIGGDFNTTLGKFQARSHSKYFNKAPDSLYTLLNKLDLSQAYNIKNSHTFHRKINTDKKNLTILTTIDYILVSTKKLHHVTCPKIHYNYPVKSDHNPISIKYQTFPTFEEPNKITPNKPKLQTKSSKFSNVANISIPDHQLADMLEQLQNCNNSQTISKFTDSLDNIVYTLTESKVGTHKVNTKNNWKTKSPKSKLIREIKSYLLKIKALGKYLTNIKYSKIHHNKMIALAKACNHLLTKMEETESLVVKPFTTKLSEEYTNLKYVLKIVLDTQKSTTSKLKSQLIHEKIVNKLKALKSNPKSVYRTALTKYAPKVSKWITDTNGCSFLDPINKLRIFTEAWSKIYKHKTPPPKPTSLWNQIPTGPYSGSLTQPITTEEFYKAIGKSFKAPGKSAIPYEVIKLLPNSIINIYIALFNHILIHKHIPDSWKVAHISLLEKDPHNTHNPLNYRPISLLECQYKIFSAILYNRLHKHIYSNNHISCHQLGFKKGVSTHNHLITLINTIEDSKQFHKPLYIASIDLVKAYDSVQHWAIKQALNRCNIDPNLTELIMNLHIGAQACITTNDGHGEYFPINRGVRQGDVLAPLLFNLVINPAINEITKKPGYLLEKCHAKVACLAYADDLLLVSNSHSNLQEMCNILSDFLDHHNMNINPTKSIFTANIKSLPILIQKHPILPMEPDTSFKYLGIWFNTNLDWNKSITCSMNSAINKLKILTTKRWIPLDTKIFIINNIILKAFEYTANYAPFNAEHTKILSEEIATCVKYSIPMHKLTPNDQMWASKKAAGLSITHVETLINVAVLRTAHKNALSDADTLACSTTQSRLYHDRFLNANNIPLFCKPASLLSDTEIPSNTYSNRILKAAELLNINIHCNHNVSPLPEDHITLPSITKKFSDFNVRVLDIIHNNKLISFKEMVKIAPTITLADHKLLALNLSSINRSIKKKLVGQVPFKLSPQNQNPSTCYTWNNDNVPIWTDGSSVSVNPSKSIHGWGIFFKPNSALNTWKRTNLETDITSAELTAIEYALAIAPLSKNTTIFTDSLNSITFISESLSWDLNIWNKCPYASTLYRIHKLVKNRKLKGNTVHFHHIYSHIEMKKRTWPKDKLHLLSDQETALNNSFPGKYSTIKQGNDQADILASAAVKTSKCKYQRPPSLVKYDLIDKNTNNQIFNLTIQGRSIQYQKWDCIKAHREGPRLEPPYSASEAAANINKTNFWIKLNNHALATRALTAKYPNIKAKHPLAHSSPNCPFCNLNVPETTIHCICECPAWEAHRINLIKELQTICRQKNIPNPNNLVLTKDNDYISIPKNLSDWTLYPQLSASLGNIPHTYLSNTYGNYLNNSEINNLAIEFSKVIIKCQATIYNDRNKLFNDKYNS